MARSKSLFYLAYTEQNFGVIIKALGAAIRIYFSVFIFIALYVACCIYKQFYNILRFSSSQRAGIGAL